MNNPIRTITKTILLISFVLASWACSSPSSTEIQILYDQDNPQSQFAVEEIIQTLEAKNYTINTNNLSVAGDPAGKVMIMIGTLSDNLMADEQESPGNNPSQDLTEEGFSIKTNLKGSNRTIWVVGGDKAGAMYGGLELAEHVKIYGLVNVEDTT